MKTPYLFQVLLHKWFVLIAGIKVGRFPIWRLLIHDWSKFTPTEFGVYRRRFTGKKYTETEWKTAWLHHIHFNPHHWEHWLLKAEPLPMPEIYIREMVIDWMGAGRGYQGSWEIQEWLNGSFSKMKLHPETILKLDETLRSIGYHLPNKTT